MDEEGFETFWKIYPRRVAKIAAMKAWKRVKEDTQVLQGVEKWKASGMWDDIRFVPYPASFLNGKRWEGGRTLHGHDLTPGTRYCSRCGRTGSWHLRLIGRRGDDGHAFVEEHDGKRS